MSRGYGRTIAPRFPPSGATKRAQDAAVQVSSIRPALPQHPCRRPQHIQSSTTPYLPIDAEVLTSRSDGAVARCRRNSMKPDPSVSHSRLATVTVTTPACPQEHHALVGPIALADDL